MFSKRENKDGLCLVTKLFAFLNSCFFSSKFFLIVFILHIQTIELFHNFQKQKHVFGY